VLVETGVDTALRRDDGIGWARRSSSLNVIAAQAGVHADFRIRF